MNLLDDEIDYIARRVKAVLLARGDHAVWANKNGALAMYPASDVRNSKHTPREFVGNYVRTAMVADIADDLRARQAELAKPWEIA
jgi:hypothetical protein